MRSQEDLRARVAAALQRKSQLPEAQCKNIAFHMTDWAEDLARLCDVFRRSDSVSDQEIYQAVLGFLLHAPEHIAKATEDMVGEPIQGIFSEPGEGGND